MTLDGELEEFTDFSTGKRGKTAIEKRVAVRSLLLNMLNPMVLLKPKNCGK